MKTNCWNTCKVDSELGLSFRRLPPSESLWEGCAPSELTYMKSIIAGPLHSSQNRLHTYFFVFGIDFPKNDISRRVPPCAVKTCAVRPVFARMVGELRAADASNVQGPVKQNASPGEQSEGPRPRWKPGQEENPGPENQDNQHMLEQPRGYFPEFQLPRICIYFSGINFSKITYHVSVGDFQRITWKNGLGMIFLENLISVT